MKKGGKGAKGKKGGQWSYPTIYGQGQGYGQPQPYGYQQVSHQPMDTIQKAKAMASNHGTMLAKARRDSRTGWDQWDYNYSEFNQGAEHQQCAEQQPVQHIGLFGVSSGSGPLPINNVVCNDNKKIQLNAQTPRHLRDFWAVIIDTDAAISVCPMTFCVSDL
eukprot:4408247-Amphidinium_carterae.2